MRPAASNHANKSAQRLLASNCGLGVCGGRLAHRRPAASARLQALVAAAASPGPGVANRWVDVDRPAGPPMAAFNDRRAGRRHAITLVADAASVLICIADPETRPTIPADRLRELFGLTATEARLALWLLRGETLHRACDGLKSARHTVRAQLASIFSKTQTSRQSELITLMMRVIMP